MFSRHADCRAMPESDIFSFRARPIGVSLPPVACRKTIPSESGNTVSSSFNPLSIRKSADFPSNKCPVEARKTSLSVSSESICHNFFRCIANMVRETVKQIGIKSRDRFKNRAAKMLAINQTAKKPIVKGIIRLTLNFSAKTPIANANKTKITASHQVKIVFVGIRSFIKVEKIVAPKFHKARTNTATKPDKTNEGKIFSLLRIFILD